MLKLGVTIAADKYFIIIDENTINSFLLNQRGLDIQERDLYPYKQLTLYYEFSLLLFKHLQEIINNIKFSSIESNFQPIQHLVALDFIFDKFSTLFSPCVKVFADSEEKLNLFVNAYIKYKLIIKKIFPYPLNHHIEAENISFKITSAEFLIKNLEVVNLIKINLAISGLKLEVFVHKQLIEYLCLNILNARNLLSSTIAAMLELLRIKIINNIEIELKIIKISEYTGIIQENVLAINLNNDTINEYVYLKESNFINLEALMPIFFKIANIFQLQNNENGTNYKPIFSDKIPIKIPLILGSLNLTIEELHSFAMGDIIFLQKLFLPQDAIADAVTTGLIAKAL